MIKEFFTEKGVIVPAVTTTQMKEIDRIAVEETGPNLLQMMENAGRNVTEITLKVLGDIKEQSIIVLSGTGGNGGGGISAARHLANRGYDVKVCITEPSKLSEVPKYQVHTLSYTTAKIISLKELSKEKPDIIIDAIIGYSLKSVPKGRALELIKWANQQLGIKISLDVPSGVNATTGETSKNFVRPDLTLTLALPKTGLLPEITGELFLGDIGIPQGLFQRIGINLPDLFSKDYIIKLTAKD